MRRKSRTARQVKYTEDDSSDEEFKLSAGDVVSDLDFEESIP